MSKIPKVFTIKSIMNHFLCDNWADFQREMPFQKIDQIVITISNHIGKTSSAANGFIPLS